jgi:tetratricopeptide (TPR) repeat protein
VPALSDDADGRLAERASLAGSTASAPRLPAAHAPASPGRATLRQYAIVRELGKGGMGVVYEAFDTVLKRKVAIKTILDPARARPNELERFRREALAAARVPHPGIVQVFETGEHLGKPYLVMELVDGESLAALLDREIVPPRRVAEIVRGVALALEHAHGHGIIHRDVKPGNVLLDREGRPRLTDFGLARDASFTAQLTATGDLLGTPAYMAPEQMGGVPGGQGPPLDVYGLGGLLYRALTGKPPFEAASTQALLYKVLTQDPAPLRRLSPGVHRDLETVALRCLEKEPSKRYPSAGAVAEDLRRYLEGEPILARPMGGLERSLRLVRRNKPLAAAVALALAASVGALGLVVHSKGEAERSKVEAERGARRGMLLEARDEALAAVASFERARKERRVPYATGLVLENEAVQEELLEPGREALRATEVFEALARRDGEEAGLVREAGRLRYETAMALAAIALDYDQLAMAGRAYEEALRARPGDARAESARRDLRERGPAILEAIDLASAAMREMEMHRFERVTRLAEEALAKDRRCAWALYVRANLAATVGRSEDAERDYTDAIALKPLFVDAWINRGVARAQRGENDEAIADERRAHELDPRRIYGYVVEANVDLGRGALDAASATIEKALALPDRRSSNEYSLRAQAFTLRGLIKLQRGDLAAADADYTLAIERDPTYVEPLWHRGEVRARLGRRDEAIADLEKFLALAPQDPNAATVRAELAQLRAGR